MKKSFIFVGMNIKSEIKWIQSELKEVRDPHLIEAFKQMLAYRKSKPSIVRLSKSEFIAEIKEAENQIERGNYLSIEEFEKQSEKWD